ncbi:MAG TPA: hypothetical protein P5246_05090, partial [Candidatus Omnitrophota bacterium]|nr:hypothetical protein [Candidatus Omnitrophota bacterium]
MTRNAVHNLRLFRSRAAKLSLAFGLFLSFNPSVLSAQTRSLTIRTYLSPPIEAFDRIRLIPNLPAANGSSCDPGSFYLNSSAGPLFCDNGTWRSFSSVWSKNDDILTLKNTDWQYQRVGIGTSEPQFKLSLDQDGGILAKDVLAAGSSSYSNPPEIRDSAALLWSPRTASLRAGEVRGPTLWRSTNISSYSTVFGLNNTTTSVGSAYSSILGGENNLIANTNFSTIIGGMNNALNAPSSGNFQAILGGSGNLIGSYNCNGCLIGGGQSNTIRTSFYSAIGGGSGNFMDRGNGYNAIIGGSGNMIQLNEKSFIGGGQNNLLTMETLYDAQNLSLIPNSQPAFSSIIGGGGNGFTPVNGLPSQGNLIGGSAYSMIGGGSGNQVRGLFYNVVYGGQNNRIVALNASLQPKNIHASSIGGGKSNTVLSSFSLIGGGESNVAGLAASSHEA